MPVERLPDRTGLSLQEYITSLSPELEAPHHLRQLCDELDAAIEPHEGQRFFHFSVPPRHWKTLTLRHAVAKHLERWPEEGVAYASHTATFANKQSREVRKLARKAGLRLALDSNRQDEWELTTGGGLTARGVDGEFTGRGFRLMILDDPIKSRAQAESAVERERIWNAIDEDILTRLSPDGCVFLVHTRWHPDDPIGRAKKQEHWRGVNIPALSGPEEDEPLLPHVWGFQYLDRIRRANAYKFASLYQGNPRPRGGALFKEPTFYKWPDEIPSKGYRVAYGVDLAYSSKTHSDFSVCLKMLKVGSDYYVTDLVRRQVDAPSFTLAIKALHSQERGPIWWYASGVEKGAGDFVSKKVPLKVKPATADKYIRAQPVSEAWNEGRILIPTGEDAPDWADDLIDEVCSFTGVKDPHDDIVDALAAAYDAFGHNKMRDALEEHRKNK